MPMTPAAVAAMTTSHQHRRELFCKAQRYAEGEDKQEPQIVTSEAWY